MNGNEAMNCIIITFVGAVFILWNISVLEVNPRAYLNLLLACTSGFALAVYIIRYLINSLSKPQCRSYNFKQ
jgi:hypothetical protein